jgi:LAO/AO transport system kinase
MARADAVTGGDLRAAAALMRDLDDEMPGARADLAALYPRTGRAFVAGITGQPGVGKSTIVDGLIAFYRGRGERVGVVAVDPSSPFSGGALLGDRVRMQRHATDEGVFIRSVATRGQTGGLSRSTVGAVAVLDAAGFPVILVETVGVGQDEVDVAGAADAVVVVTAPGLGDEVQALKAGVYEIADVLVVNKGDREGADLAMKDLASMMQIAERPAPALLRTAAAHGQGLSELGAALEAVRAAPAEARAARRRQQALRQVLAVVSDVTRQRALRAIGDDGRPGLFAQTIDDVAARKLDPFAAADAIVASASGALSSAPGK